MRRAKVWDLTSGASASAAAAGFAKAQDVAMPARLRHFGRVRRRTHALVGPVSIASGRERRDRVTHVHAMIPVSV